MNAQRGIGMAQRTPQRIFSSIMKEKLGVGQGRVVVDVTKRGRHPTNWNFLFGVRFVLGVLGIACVSSSRRGPDPKIGRILGYTTER
jgi:hypothetical protein